VPVRSCRSQRPAEDALPGHDRRARDGERRDANRQQQGRPTARAARARWLLESVKDSVKLSTYEGYSDLTRRHVIPAFGRTKLKDLTTDRVRNFRRSKLDEGLSPRGQFSTCCSSCARRSSRPWKTG
jgi:hypothetical protein